MNAIPAPPTSFDHRTTSPAAPPISLDHRAASLSARPASLDRRTASLPALPPPATRLRLREAWGLSRPQVAAAFGVTAATVRHWESGRSSPRGARRRAYAELLTGLAAMELSPAAPKRATEESAPTPRSWYPARVAPVGTPVKPLRPDPVSESRRRRWRRAAAAAGCWTLVLHLLMTMPVMG
ncbi:helix-turn-helix domain-containing protein [Streptomyces sp. NPDC015130]|uniref:helix-turn-helix domain-containing protein n=1 Tax=Streptomyces sp. NPDC015130 TaxID=3364940 RepID=UPI0036F73F10